MQREGFQGGHVLSLKIVELGRKYESFRFVAPRVEEKLALSLRQNGQLSPITVVDEESIYQVLDGFKRVRAAEEIAGLESLEAKCTPPGSGKAMMLRLNLDRKGLDPVEEGLLMKAMHRDDGMAQSEIAGLIGRHRSWVCRRIALVERLDLKVVENLRLGLITSSQGRALALLPRGNQQDVLAEILGFGLTSRETERLVTALNLKGIYDPTQIKMEAAEIQASKQTERKEKPARGEPMDRLLYAMKAKCSAVTDYLETHPEWMPWKDDRTGAAREAASWAVTQLESRLRGSSHGK
jgi:ParB/RepB/Spo0J family partition protein